MPDQDGYITKETDSVLWEALYQIWKSDKYPGITVKNEDHYITVVTADIPKFKLVENKSLYDSISMKGL